MSSFVTNKIEKLKKQSPLIISTFKTALTIVGLVFSISNFFNNKMLREGHRFMKQNSYLKKLGFSYLEHCHPDHHGAVEEFPELLFPPPQPSFCRFSCFPESHQMHPITSSSHVFKNYVLRIYEIFHEIFIAFFLRFS